MGKQIFLSYRRSDSADVTGRVHEYLINTFGEDAIFFDVINSIPLGYDFGEYILEAAAQVKAMLVVVGKGWAEVKDNEDNLRLHDPDDWVRVEVESGLAQDKPYAVIPLFVGGAKLDTAPLPESLKPLSRRNGRPIRPEPDFEHDMSLLIESLVQLGIPRLPTQGQEGTAGQQANLQGSGAIAQGDGAIAVGKRGVMIGGDAKDNIIITGDSNMVEKKE